MIDGSLFEWLQTNMVSISLFLVRRRQTRERDELALYASYSTYGDLVVHTLMNNERQTSYECVFLITNNVMFYTPVRSC